MLNFSNLDTHIILVDDEQSELDAYGFLLESMGVKQIVKVRDSRELMSVMAELPPSIVFLDLNMPHKSGQAVLTDLKKQYPYTPVIICTANSDLETAVECLKKGAHDYLVKPINMNTFGSALRNALEIFTLRNEVMNLKGVSFTKDLQHPDCFSNIITKNAEMLCIFQYIESIAPSGQPALILGETGSGKDMIAKAIHDASGVPGEFVAVDVSGLDDTLFSDTMFGHIKGAYTGADKPRSGLIEKAKNGTIFLDEIGDLTEPSQVKLLRLLQDGIYYPLGDDQAKQSQARVITATNKEINKLVAVEKGFRRDLYYRLSTHLIRLLPLRERKEDIPLLVEYLKDEAATSMNKNIPYISPELIRLLVSHPFPGNIRELKTYIYDAVAQCQTDELTESAISDRIDQEIAFNPYHTRIPKPNPLESLFGNFPTLQEIIEYTVDQALSATKHNQSQAARLLGISKQALSKRLKRRQGITDENQITTEFEINKN